MNKQTIISFGFIIEVLLFVCSGILLMVKPILAIVTFTMGIAMALEVGKMIKNKAIKYG